MPVTINRRKAILSILIVSATAVLFPYCREADKSVMQLKNFNINSNQQDMLAELCESILPKTKNFIGAKDLNAHGFVLKMMDDCQPPEKQKLFTDGLKAFNDLCDKKFTSSFVKCTATQRNELLTQLEIGLNDEKNTAAQFYGFTKVYTLQCFTGSKEYMTAIKKYKIVPGGNFKGCEKI